MEVGVGFTEEHVSLSKFVGWNLRSWGYHGDDGSQWTNGGIDHFNEKYGIGDTIGCGLNFRRKEVFYTKNGAVLGRFRELSAY
jgi:hypothetical protein